MKPLVQSNSNSSVELNLNMANEEPKDLDTELSAMAQGIQSWLDSFQNPTQSADDQQSILTGSNQLH
jgi:hypothetical protein